MSIRLAQRLFTAGLLVAGATALAAGPAGAATTHSSVVASHAAPTAQFRHHGHANCNNDPDSEFAMDPDICPPSNNADAYGDYGYPGDYDYGYGYPGRY